MKFVNAGIFASAGYPLPDLVIVPDKNILNPPESFAFQPKPGLAGLHAGNADVCSAGQFGAGNIIITKRENEVTPASAVVLLPEEFWAKHSVDRDILLFTLNNACRESVCVRIRNFRDDGHVHQVPVLDRLLPRPGLNAAGHAAACGRCGVRVRWSRENYGCPYCVRASATGRQALNY